jgi:5-methylcytosine-specific restriction enzyme A
VVVTDWPALRLLVTTHNNGPRCGEHRQGRRGTPAKTREYLELLEFKSNKILEVVMEDIEAFEEEISSSFEGGRKQKLMSYYERDTKLRAKAIEIHGTTCMVCQTNFEAKYGTHGKDYIEVHHLTPLHTLIEKSLISPKEDMAVLCANCHRMIHRKKNMPLTIKELKEIWNRLNGI